MDKWNMTENSGGEMTVHYGVDNNYGLPCVYIRLSDTFFFGMEPDQARALGEKLIEAAGKVTQ